MSRGYFAWRAWGLSRDNPGLLCSILDPFPASEIVEWPGRRKLRAECAFNDHEAPDIGCRCGWRGQPDLDELVWWLNDFKHVNPHVIGGVILSGRVMRGDVAHPEIPGILRAEYAEVHGPLIVGPIVNEASAVDALAESYGVRVYPSPTDNPWRWISQIDLSALPIVIM